jgi:hypothetical protein
MSAKPFEMGLVMAGAISAGAYTGGVIDFLIQALDEWYKAKDAGSAVPSHDVKLKVMSGASAGGITAAIAAGAIASRFPPVTDLESTNSDNKLFDSWVNQIDITSLLAQQDLQDDKAIVRSLLDSTILQKIADNALNINAASQRRPYVDDVLHVLTTVSNLRGVPYNIPFQNQLRGGHELYLHADYVHFAVSDSGKAKEPGALPLDWQKADPALRGNWDRLKAAALASGAFPVGLMPRVLDYRSADGDMYGTREWPIPCAGDKDVAGQSKCIDYKPIAPSWGDKGMPSPFGFLCVDGGLMNNEPLELARQILTGGDPFNPRSADEAHRAIILIDPFPGGDAASDYVVKDDLINVLLSMFNALKNQARFKPEELELAQRADCYSRFLIAPTRMLPNGSPAEHPIACGVLGGFGGFLARAFREHDFMLGRRNCQRFLLRYFNLAEDNPVVAVTSDQAVRAQFCTKDDQGRPQTENGKRLLPIIPLVGTAAKEVPQSTWPGVGNDQITALKQQIEQRFDAVADHLVDQFFASKGELIRGLARQVAHAKRDDVADFAIKKVVTDLKAFGMLP